jgi:hypothetical protein
VGFHGEPLVVSSSNSRPLNSFYVLYQDFTSRIVTVVAVGQERESGEDAAPAQSAQCAFCARRSSATANFFAIGSGCRTSRRIAIRKDTPPNGMPGRFHKRLAGSSIWTGISRRSTELLVTRHDAFAFRQRTNQNQVRAFQALFAVQGHHQPKQIRRQPLVDAVAKE